jgi:hypothetical protein
MHRTETLTLLETSARSVPGKRGSPSPYHERVFRGLSTGDTATCNCVA